MATHIYMVSVFLIFASCNCSLPNAYSTEEESKCDSCNQTIISRGDFSEEFIFGAASSSYQYEGAFNETGKGQGMWDNFTHSYPGIEPFVTILHFDVPQALEDSYGGFLSSRIVDDFVDFAKLLFHQFGDRVKYWITINEPWTFSIYGYEFGWFAPGRCSNSHDCTAGNSATESYIVMHNQLLAHTAVVNLYRNKYQALQEGRIGISLASYWFEPYDETNLNRQAKDRALDFMIGWIMEPLTVGKYPESMRVVVGHRLPQFTQEQMNKMKGSFDFIGINYYGAIYAFNKVNFSSFSFPMDSKVDVTGERNGKPIGKQGRNSSRIYIYPKGLREIVKYIKQKYNDPLIYITENGLDEDTNATLEVADGIKDEMRKDYIRDHLCCLRESIKKDGVNVKGYFVWSLMDNFEWASGFSVRFGLNYVDFKDNSLKRYPKESALWFKTFLRNPKHRSRVVSMR
ncbi:hypothetical protein RD792_002304 [Penstemon davidsonii]|uniref:Beta-glucosidase n=1 Tax=Penstemon davidsonii TaxID=160366 RepID=A0ABR0DQP1_9LAMI|nr:hypothetical protein RD792_002304 [Penstemon davidsonii]